MGISMNIRNFRMLFIALMGLTVSFSGFAQSTITINSGSTLLISGGELVLDCEDVEVILNSGGTLQITAGIVKDLNLTRKSGSSFQISGGKVTECDSFYIIVAPDGKTAIINL